MSQRVQNILLKSLESKLMTSFCPLKLQRAYYLAKYHHFRQLAYRLFNLLLSRSKWIIFRFFISQKSKHQNMELKANTISIHDYPEGLLPILKVPTKIGPNLFPPKPQCDLLIEFEFHSHKHLLQSSANPKAWEEIAQWIKAFPPKHTSHFSPTWHPYVVSKRIQTWISLWIMEPPNSNLQTVVLQSLWEQGTWLFSSLEKDIGGNHLWENAQSLTLLALFLDCPQSQPWLVRGMSLLKTVLSIQVLPSGEHFEKSPSYHWELTQGLELLLPWIKNKHPEEYNWVKTVQSKMLLFATQIAHPNGTLPLFNDAWKTEVPCNDELYSKWVGDYFVSKAKDSFFIFDAGNMGPDELPAHSHCDLLTFELAIKKNVLITNSGTFTYQGIERTSYRGTQAHNVLVVNEQNTADIWGAFRMGRRGHVIDRGSLDNEHGTWIWGRHDGYDWSGTPQVMRVWFVAQEPFLFCSFYLLKVDRPLQTLEEFIHFSPGTVLSPLETKQVTSQVLIQQDSFSQNYWQSLSPLEYLKVEETRYSPKFYEQSSNQTLKLRAHKLASHPDFQLATAWTLHSGAKPLKIALDFSHPKIKLYLETELKALTTEFTIPHP